MGRLLAVLGVALTTCYLMFAWWLVGERLLVLRTMELNEIGDFLAGVFGPLAILWLVLGFFQQGIELRQSTNALKMQAEELKSSVAQQAAMVEVSQKQLDAALATAQYERELSEKSCEPHTDFQFKHWFIRGGEQYAKFSVRNSGPRCTSLSIVFSISDTDQLNLGFFEVFSEKELEVEIPALSLPRSEWREFSLSCTKANGTRTYESYRARVMKPRYGSEHIQIVRA